MINRYTTKNDINGNQYQLIVDHEKKTVKKGYSLFVFGDRIKTTKKNIYVIYEAMKAAGYAAVED